MQNIFSKIHRGKILSPRSLYFLTEAIITQGLNLMAILHFASKIYPDNPAVNDPENTTSFKQLYEDSIKLAMLLKQKYQLEPHQPVALICRNHIQFLISMFAFFRLGVDVYLLNIEMSKEQINQVVSKNKFQLIVCDDEIENYIKTIVKETQILSVKSSFHSVTGLLQTSEMIFKKLKRPPRGKMVVLTAGTTGEFKTAGRKPPIGRSVIPLISMLTLIKINHYKSVYIATPLCHSYGLSALIVSIFLGKETYILPKFNTLEACRMIKDNHIEAIILVPLMLWRLLACDSEALKILKCIISGGAPLDANLSAVVLDRCGDILYNFYGTTEVGFSILATPVDLRKHPSTIGRKIIGASIMIQDKDGSRVKPGKPGMIAIKSKWGMLRQNNKWIRTGDMGYINPDGYIFILGRSDNMIVSGGENVYPEELERVLLKNPLVENVAVIGIADKEFGQRLKAFVVPNKDVYLTEDMIMNWLQNKVAKYQLPAVIMIVDMLPMSSAGKIDKKTLEKM